MELPIKYLQDKQGDKFVPVTAPNAVRWPDGEDLTDKLMQSDWEQNDSDALDYIKNRPNIPNTIESMTTAEIDTIWNTVMV